MGVSFIDGHLDNTERCVCCGREIPEGRQYCVICGKVTAEKKDMVEVVRCKDCKRCEVYYPRKAKGKEAEIAYYCTNLDCVVEPTDFCSYGVRKGEE